MYWYTGILGVLLIIAPFVLGYSSNGGATWTSVILGALTVIFSIIESQSQDRQPWEYWVIGLIGVLALIAPPVFHFTAPLALWSTIILGGLMAFLAGIKLEQEPRSEIR